MPLPKTTSRSCMKTSTFRSSNARFRLSWFRLGSGYRSSGGKQQRMAPSTSSPGPWGLSSRRSFLAYPRCCALMGLAQDDLVHEGGIATICVSTSSDPRDKQDGVYWSLPLANLRYYGTVRCERSSFHDSRLSLVELQALALGASLDTPDDAVVASSFLTALWDHCFNVYDAWCDALWFDYKGSNGPKGVIPRREEDDQCATLLMCMRVVGVAVSELEF
ncbi:hypothetical protein BJX64DRAFT_201582 [Aspergillus heterothallicus]